MKRKDEEIETLDFEGNKPSLDDTVEMLDFEADKKVSNEIDEMLDFIDVKQTKNDENDEKALGKLLETNDGATSSVVCSYDKRFKYKKCKNQENRKKSYVVRYNSNAIRI